MQRDRDVPRTTRMVFIELLILLLLFCELICISVPRWKGLFGARNRVRKAVLTDCSSGKSSAADSERQIEDLDELVAVDDAFAPDGFEIGERPFRDGFQDGFSSGLQFLNAIAGGDEHVPGFREVRFVA